MRIGISALGRLSENTGDRTCIEMKWPHEYSIFFSGPEEDAGGELRPNFHKITMPFSRGSSLANGSDLQFVLP